MWKKLTAVKKKFTVGYPRLVSLVVSAGYPRLVVAYSINGRPKGVLYNIPLTLL